MLSKASMQTDSLQQFQTKAKHMGLKMTRQRLAIAEVFFTAEIHLTVEQILEKARWFDAKISLATVYRTMRLLEACGFARVHQFGEGQAVFEPQGLGNKLHDHLVCTSCGQIEEFEEPQLEKIQQQVARQYCFIVSKHRLEFYGLCPKCY